MKTYLKLSVILIGIGLATAYAKEQPTSVVHDISVSNTELLQKALPIATQMQAQYPTLSLDELLGIVVDSEKHPLYCNPCDYWGKPGHVGGRTIPVCIPGGC